MRLGTSFIILIFAMALPLSTLAGPPNAPADPQSLFESGRAAMKIGHFQEALTLITKSNELDPGRGKILNIAICEEQLGKLAGAYAHFQELAAQIPPGDPRRPSVDDYLAKLPARIPHLHIDLARSAPPGTAVMMDGTAVGKAKLETDMLVDVGTHRIVVTSPGRLDKPYEVMSEEGKSASLSVEPGAEVPAPVPSTSSAATTKVTVPPVPSDAPKRSLVPAIVLGVVSAAGFGVGAVFAFMRGDKRSDAEARSAAIISDRKSCIPTAGNFDATRCPGARNATSTGDTFGTVSLSGFIVGGTAALAALGAFYVLWPAPRQSPTTGLTIRIAPAVNRFEQGAMIWGSF